MMGTQRFEYDAQHRLLAHWNAAGRIVPFRVRRRGARRAHARRRLRAREALRIRPRRSIPRSSPTRAERPGPTATTRPNSRWKSSIRSGHVSRFEYDAQGRLLAATDQAGNSTVVLFDDAGRPAGKVAPDGAVWTVTDRIDGVTLAIAARRQRALRYAPGWADRQLRHRGACAVPPSSTGSTGWSVQPCTPHGPARADGMERGWPSPRSIPTHRGGSAATLYDEHERLLEHSDPARCGDTRYRHRADRLSRRHRASGWQPPKPRIRPARAHPAAHRRMRQHHALGPRCAPVVAPSAEPPTATSVHVQFDAD